MEQKKKHIYEPRHEDKRGPAQAARARSLRHPGEVPAVHQGHRAIRTVRQDQDDRGRIRPLERSWRAFTGRAPQVS